MRQQREHTQRGRGGRGGREAAGAAGRAVGRVVLLLGALLGGAVLSGGPAARAATAQSAPIAPTAARAETAASKALAPTQEREGTAATPGTAGREGIAAREGRDATAPTMESEGAAPPDRSQAIAPAERSEGWAKMAAMGEGAPSSPSEPTAAALPTGAAAAGAEPAATSAASAPTETAADGSAAPAGRAGPASADRAGASPPAAAAGTVNARAAVAGPGEASAGGAGETDAEREARAAAAAGREPAVLEHGDYVLVPFGHQVPVVRCAPLRVCLIELEERELVLNTVTGDAARWILDRAVAGPRGATTVIVAKPTACNLTTNLVITTDRRIYQITLDARPCKGEEGENPHQPFTRLLRFYYPDELVRTWASAEQARRAAAADAARAVTRLGPEGGGLADGGGLPLAALHFNYRWTRSGKYPWTPVAVFDDQVHTYIRLPGSGLGQESPVLFLIDRRGATALLNYAIRGQYYVTDRVFERAALVLGSGRDQQRLDIFREH
jgi:P-type conjugative transfer protein TrbG